MRRKRRGFTLLELLVATTIMGIAVVALLANLSTSLRTASRLTGRDRAALLAQQKLEELVAQRALPPYAEGRFDAREAGGVEAGWNSRAEVFEASPQGGPGAPMLQRVAVEVWWREGPVRKTLALETYRRGQIPLEGP